MGHAYLLAEWGRAGDTAVVAEVDGQAVGAAWYRYWTDSSHSYGYVDDSTPEVGIGEEPGSRACGVGMSLMIRLLEQAAGQGVRCVSLSVARDNAAASLCRRLGFERYADVESSWTMLKRLGS
jgi:GNAT superfamily N-acetyltransferase